MPPRATEHASEIREILETLLTLPPEQLGEVHDFSRFLQERYGRAPSSAYGDEWSEEDLRDLREASLAYAARALPLDSITTRPHTKLVHEGEYLAEVDVQLMLTDDAWSPYLSLEDAYRLDQVREALRQGDIEAAAQMARVYKLVPVAA